MIKTKLLVSAFIAVFTLLSLDGNAQITTPMPSPAGGVSSTVGLTKIEINYFRPQMKGRKVFGDGDAFLVPNGKLWRAGANSGTKVNFSDNVKIAGKDLAAGEYLLLTTPGASEWEVVFYSDLSIGGNMGKYDDSKAALKVMVKSSKLTESVSTLTYAITDISENSQNANIQMSWENTALNIPVEVSFDEAIMATIAEKTQVDPGNLIAAAKYYYANDKDMDQALSWVNTYLSTGDNGKQFWNVHLKAQILAKKGDKKAAIKTANESITAAKAYPDGDFGYVKKNEDFIKSLK